MPGCLPMLTSFFVRFFIDFCSQLGPPEPPKSLKLYWFYRHFWLCGIFNIRSNFDPILVPTWLHFGSRNPPKSSQKSIPRCIKKSIDFCIGYFRHVGPALAPKFRQLGRQWRHLGPQDSPTWPPRGSKKLDSRSHFSMFFPKWPPRRPKTDFGRNFH